ncbi:YMGG-like glycine zipper-containing protein [Consotaella aegiceratis]|uniref:YMGG-like glycine zipper-containing protein n=1 Tax=Consotaella aegiceratis TaxID=3097961 RepID=UPI002F41BAE5
MTTTLLCAALASTAACTHTEKTVAGGAVGAVGGAVVGGAVGDTPGAIVGGVAGGLGGAAVGSRL